MNSLIRYWPHSSQGFFQFSNWLLWQKTTEQVDQQSVLTIKSWAALTYQQKAGCLILHRLDISWKVRAKNQQSLTKSFTSNTVDIVAQVIERERSVKHHFQTSPIEDQKQIWLLEQWWDHIITKRKRGRLTSFLTNTAGQSQNRPHRELFRPWQFGNGHGPYQQWWQRPGRSGSDQGQFQWLSCGLG